MSCELIPAAAYVRMSDEHQKYSPENQHFAIQKYAQENGFVVVVTYEDNSRSGVVLIGHDHNEAVLLSVLLDCKMLVFRRVLLVFVGHANIGGGGDQFAAHVPSCLGKSSGIGGA